jgi:hypothetical protein
MKPVLRRGKLLIVTTALACGGLAASVAAARAELAALAAVNASPVPPRRAGLRP